MGKKKEQIVFWGKKIQIALKLIRYYISPTVKGMQTQTIPFLIYATGKIQ